MVYAKMVNSTSGQLARRPDALKIVTVNGKNHRPKDIIEIWIGACLQAIPPIRNTGRNEFVLTTTDTFSHFHNVPCQPTEMNLVIV